MLIDLHCHTKVYSACSALTPDALVRAARARGLDGICITEHDALWPPDEIERLEREMGFPVFRGMEVTTEVGHVLVYGAVRHRPEMASLATLRRLAREDGALLVLAHPSRRYGTLPPADLAVVFDAVEAQNGSEGALQNENAGQLARGLRLPGIGGSDAHSAREVGICATRFAAEVRGEAAFLAALGGGAYAAERV
ncbi:MAG: PHP domain-containing protein [Candidatus Binataceae bacterium]|nr:PHP domain-containing protein [Candidatus Binataceae bacterium]